MFYVVKVGVAIADRQGNNSWSVEDWYESAPDCETAYDLAVQHIKEDAPVSVRVVHTWLLGAIETTTVAPPPDKVWEIQMADGIKTLNLPKIAKTALLESLTLMSKTSAFSDKNEVIFAFSVWCQKVANGELDFALTNYCVNFGKKRLAALKDAARSRKTA